MIRNETKRQYHDRRLQSLKDRRNPYHDQWRELAEYNDPSRLRFTEQETGRGQKLRSKIVDGTASLSLRTLASGMHSGITSPARPWFRLATFDEDLREYPPVKEYTNRVERLMRDVFSGSNLYKSFHYGYQDMALFGQSVALQVRDDRRVMRLLPCIHGSFWISRDHNGVADTLYRQLVWSVESIVARFGYDKCSHVIRSAYDKGRYDERFVINHAIEPRRDRDPSKLNKENKAFTSNYWEDEGPGSGLLEESGFDLNPIIAPPWSIIANDDYAVSPGMDALPDVKALQVMQMRKGEAIEKKVRPPMTGPTSLMDQPKSLMPGSVTYVDDPTGKGYRAAIEVNLSISELSNDILETQQRIDRTYYADLFLMLTQMDGIQPRNEFEIAERKEEKLLALGPVLENIYGGQLAPVIENTFAFMDDAGMLPEPPGELQGSELKIEYISMLAQAQKAISTGAIERLAAFSGNLSATKPTVLDKFDADQAFDEYAELIGVPPSVVVSDDDVAKLREQRNAEAAKDKAAEQAAMAAPALKQGADAARVMAETDAGSGNLLSKLGLG